MSSLTESGEAERPDASALWLSLLIVLAIVGSVWYYMTSRTLLDRIHARGEIRIITLNGPTTWYQGPDGDTGLEFDLASAFADFLGVKLRLLEADHLEAVLPEVQAGSADLAAAGLAITLSRQEIIDFGPPYQDVATQVVDLQGKPRPKSLDDLHGITLDVVAGTAHARRLQELKTRRPDLVWREHQDLDVDELLEQVAEGGIQYAVIGSRQFVLLRHFFPTLRVVLELGEPLQLAWAFRRDGDDSLRDQARAFFERISQDGRLTQLLERHYGHAGEFDYTDTRVFMRRAETRLASFRELFQAAAQEHGFDWRLLAAISYQESHWRPGAVSPTGVRGLMMLTRKTAGQLEVRNRMDPRESIFGGARYLARLKSRIAPGIGDPDRTWMAMAAYNVGLGHLEDARILTESQGGDPDKWVDVKQRLPLLSNKKYYRHLKYGYARGREPVRYVQNIRRYYDILVWLSDRGNRTGDPPAADPATTSALQPAAADAL